METTSHAHPRPSVMLFFICTYILSWLIWIPLALSHLGIGPFFIPDGISNLVRLFGVLGPAIVALLLSGLIGGWAVMTDLLGRLKIWRVGWRWWAAALFGQPILLVAAGLLYNRLGGAPQLALGGQGLGGGFILQVVMLAIATLGEEIGWRGLALPGLLKRHSALSASLLLGTIWCVWHLPFWLLQDSYDQFGPGYLLLNFLMIMPMSIYITWVFNHTRGSILLAAAFHLAFNIVNVSIIAVTSLITPFIIFIGASWIVALAILWHWGPETLVRKPHLTNTPPQYARPSE